MLNCLSQLKVYTLTYTSHYLHPNNVLTLDAEHTADNENDEPTEISLDIRASYPYELQLPDEVADRDVPVKENIVMDLVQKKHRYLSEVNKVTANYHRTSQSLI